MFSNSEAIFEQLSKALCRSAMYVSYADLEGGQEAQLMELQSLSVLMHVLRKEHADNLVMQDVTVRVFREIQEIGDPRDFTDEDVAAFQEHLEDVPGELKDAVKTAIANLPKKEAELYIDIIMAAGASVAQTHDEKDRGGFLERLAAVFFQFFEKPVSAFLFDSSNRFDFLSISQKEEEALDTLCNAMAEVWHEMHPNDPPKKG